MGWKQFRERFLTKKWSRQNPGLKNIWGWGWYAAFNLLWYIEDTRDIIILGWIYARAVLPVWTFRGKLISRDAVCKPNLYVQRTCSPSKYPTIPRLIAAACLNELWSLVVKNALGSVKYQGRLPFQSADESQNLHEINQKPKWFIAHDDESARSQKHFSHSCNCVAVNMDCWWYIPPSPCSD